MIKYIGSKRLLVPKIVALVKALPKVESVLDLFSGTSRVGRALKKAGYRVTANDHLAFAYALAQCYVAADGRRWRDRGREVLRELAAVSPEPGYFTDTFCVRSRFFHPKNGARVDAMRECIAQMELHPHLEAILLTALMEAADRVDSTTGVQMAYLKQWAPRALKDLELRLPDVVPGEGRALNLDAVEAAEAVQCDLAYLDPPYNQHSYMGNYHVWETLVKWDKPESYGKACKRVECRQYSSPFNSKPRIRPALRRVINGLSTRYLLVSFNNEGYISRRQMEELLSSKGHVAVFASEYRRYVGAQIGIHNPDGEKVGEVSHLDNKEFLFLVAEDRADVERAMEAWAALAPPKQRPLFA